MVIHCPPRVRIVREIRFFSSCRSRNQICFTRILCFCIYFRIRSSSSSGRIHTALTSEEIFRIVRATSCSCSATAILFSISRLRYNNSSLVSKKMRCSSSVNLKAWWHCPSHSLCARKKRSGLPSSMICSSSNTCWLVRGSRSDQQFSLPEHSIHTRCCTCTNISCTSA